VKVCITGGAGFIAAEFVRRFSASGIESVLFDVRPPNYPLNGIKFVSGDIRDASALTTSFIGCDAVLHLAAAHHDFGIADGEYFDVNERGMITVCAAADIAGIRNICFYSTVAVYGDASGQRTEKLMPMPVSPYGKSKLAAEHVLEKWSRAASDRAALVIRPTVTFGPGNFANMYSLIRQIDSGKFLPIGDGRNIKSLSYIVNIVDATLFLWNLQDPSGPRLGMNGAPQRNGFEVYNYIDKPDLTSGEIVDAIYRSLGKRPPPFRIPLPIAILLGLPFDLIIKLTGKNLPVSTARMRKLCVETKFEADRIAIAGYSPKVPLVDGIREMVEWYQREGKYQTPPPALHDGD
jgi:nucleoside-diphosphate-sugar epimerase